MSSGKLTRRDPDAYGPGRISVREWIIWEGRSHGQWPAQNPLDTGRRY